MVEYIAGLISGVYLTLLGFNFTSFVNIPWWIMIIFGIILIIGLVLLKIYLMVSDYKGLAENGFNAGKTAYRYINSKFKK